MISFVAVGHVTNDVLASGVAPGGSALYAALTAAALGCDTRIVTRHGPDFTGLPLLHAAGVIVEGGGDGPTTTFENVYDAGGRRQRVLAVGAPITFVPPADVVFCCPVIGEVAPAAVRGAAGLQGWLRRLDDEGVVHPAALDDLSFLAGCDVVFYSREDTAGAIHPPVPVVVRTLGKDGAEIVHDGRTDHVRAYPTREVDPTGAGDVFATAFLIARARGESLTSAGIYAACAASIVVESPGPSALVRLGRDLPERLAAYAKMTD